MRRRFKKREPEPKVTYIDGRQSLTLKEQYPLMLKRCNRMPKEIASHLDLLALNYPQVAKRFLEMLNKDKGNYIFYSNMGRHYYRRKS